MKLSALLSEEENKIKYSCGFCGQPMDKNKDALYDFPDSYRPEQYEHAVCHSCEEIEEEREKEREKEHWQQVEREEENRRWEKENIK